MLIQASKCLQELWWLWNMPELQLDLVGESEDLISRLIIKLDERRAVLG
jgi:hypothetical protein